MKWFKRMVIKWVREDWDNARDDQPADCYPSPKMSRGNSISNLSSSTGLVDSDATLQFKVYNAVGGKVVEFTRYDRQKDRADHQIYVIGKDEDFGEKIAKISTLEVLR
jgi:hypothetical protein